MPMFTESLVNFILSHSPRGVKRAVLLNVAARQYNRNADIENTIVGDLTSSADVGSGVIAFLVKTGTDGLMRSEWVKKGIITNSESLPNEFKYGSTELINRDISLFTK